MAPRRERVSTLPRLQLLVLLLLPLMLVPQPIAGHGGKYSREKNEPEMAAKRESGEEFRMDKLWREFLHYKEKIQEYNVLLDTLSRAEEGYENLLSPSDMAHIKSDTLISKHSELKDRLRSINQGLDRLRKVSHQGYGSTTEFEEPRVIDLWDLAQSANFTEKELESFREELKHFEAKIEKHKFSSEELDKLWREFLHYKEKIQEYNVLLDTLSRAEEGYENLLSPSDMAHIKSDTLISKHSELKDRLRSINQGLDRLRKVSHQGYGSTTEFEEPRVIDLWDLAQSANFTEKELESFREELKHFEAKIEKHNHYQKQLEISHQKLKHVESIGDPEHISRNKEKYVLLEEKTKELGYKVKKHLQDLSSRVSRARHNEL